MRIIVVALLCLIAALPMQDQKIFLGEDFEANYIEIDQGCFMFYWLFRCRHKGGSPPLIVFLNGGFGSTGVEAALNENGPYRVLSNLSLEANIYSYNSRGDVLYLDQPIGTGLSNFSESGRIPSSIGEVAYDLTIFFARFLQRYPRYYGRRTFFTGQDFAGHIIPVVVPYLIKTVQGLNVRGVSIGNPCINLQTYFQNNLYSVFAFSHNLINKIQYLLASIQSNICAKFIEFGFTNWITSIACNWALKLPIGTHNPYDITQECEFLPNCYNNSIISSFISQPSVLKVLNSTGHTFSLTSSEVFEALKSTYLEDYTPGFETLLNQNISVGLFYGDRDYACNYQGGYQWVKEELPYKYAPNISEQPFIIHELEGKKVGYTQSFGLFDFTLFYDVGHYITMEKPELAEIILDRLIGNGKYYFDYQSGSLIISLGYPPQKLALKLSLEHSYSWVATASCENCNQYSMYSESNSTNCLHTKVMEDYSGNEKLRGELVYDLIENVRVPIVFAVQAPKLETETRVSGLISVLSLAKTLFSQGKIEACQVAIFQNNSEVVIGGVNASTVGDRKICWANTTDSQWNFKLESITYYQQTYFSSAIEAQYRLDISGIHLPSEIFKSLFSEFLGAHPECEQGYEHTIDCTWTEVDFNQLPGFVINTSVSSGFILHPSSFITQSSSQYSFNIGKSEKKILLGRDVMARVYIVLDAEKNKIGFINFDKNTALPDLLEHTSWWIYFLLACASSLGIIWLIFIWLYIQTRRKYIQISYMNPEELTA